MLFAGKNKKFAIAPHGAEREKQIQLILYCFILGKVLGSRLIVAQSEHKLFPGVPVNELSYVKLCGLTCVALLTDIVCDLYKTDLTGQLDK